MTAFRLAEYVEHTTDVNAMLDAMPPELFEEWCAKDEIEPIGTPKMLATIGFMLATQILEEKPNPEDWMPWLKYSPDEKHDNDKARQILRQALGR